MDWLAVLGIVVAILGAVFSGAWFFGYQHYRQRLKESAGKRLEAAQLLFAPSGWVYYLARLRRILNNLDVWMGSLDEGGQLFSRCVSMAFIYPFVFLTISWLVNGSATIGNAELIPASGSLSFIEWFLIALGLAAIAVLAAITVLAVAIARVGSAGFAVAGTVLAAILGFLAIAGSITGAFDGLDVITGIVVAAAVAVTFAGSGAGAGAALTAVAVAGVVAFVTLLDGTSLADPKITSWLLFIILLPPINAVFDWASWWASRALGRNLVSTLEKPEVTTWRRIRTLLRDMFLDIIIAVVLLTMLAYFMPRLIDAWNGFVVMLEGEEAPIDLVDYLCAAARNPLTDGLWATLMLFSTLIPTIGHLGVLIMAFFIRSPNQLDRERAAHLRHQYRPPAKDIKGLGEEEPEKWPVMPDDYSIEHINRPDAVPMDALNVDTANAVSWHLGVFRWFWYLLAVSAAGALVYWVVTPILFYPWEPLPKILLMVAGFTWPEVQACFLEAG